MTPLLLEFGLFLIIFFTGFSFLAFPTPCSNQNTMKARDLQVHLKKKQTLFRKKELPEWMTEIDWKLNLYRINPSFCFFKHSVSTWALSLTPGYFRKPYFLTC